MAGSNTPNYLDIQAIIEDFVWEKFLAQQKISRKFRRKYKDLTRDDVYFEVAKTQLKIDKDFTPASEGDKDDSLVHQNRPSKPNTLFKTVFKNNCSSAQEYSFRQERTTESSCTVTREKSYSFGLESELCVKTPLDIIELNVGFKQEVSFTNIKEDTVVETFTWSVDSSISVPPKHETTAELVVKEMEYSGRYTQETKLGGRVIVSLVRRKDGALIMPRAPLIFDVFQSAMSGPWNQSLRNLCQLNSSDRTVLLRTEGTCRFKFATDQHVVVNEIALTEHKSTQT